MSCAERASRQRQSGWQMSSSTTRSIRQGTGYSCSRTAWTATSLSAVWGAARERGHRRPPSAGNAVWMLSGFYLSLGPSLAAQVLRSPNLLWGGVAIALLAAVAAGSLLFRGRPRPGSL